MIESAIERALGERLLTLHPTPTVIWDNDEPDAIPKPPYLVVQFTKTGRTDRTVAGTLPIRTGYMTVAVIEKQNKFTTQANNLADQIADLFPSALRLSASGQTLTITKGGDVQSGYPDGPNWRVPVRVDYRTH